MTSASDVSARPQSAAAPSPFPPIADYAFLSNCHTGALVAPDGGSAGCASRASTRRACSARSWTGRRATSGWPRSTLNVPAAREYEPGTNTLVTTWQVSTGWIVVRDALRSARGAIEDRITPHTRPPFDDDADHLLVRTVECIEGSVEIDLICEPVFDYGRATAEWTLVGDDRHVADAQGAGVTLRLATDLSLDIEGDPVRARHSLQAGERAFCSLSWAEDPASPADADEARRDSRRRPASGAPGWPAPGSPIIAGASRSRARR